MKDVRVKTFLYMLGILDFVSVARHYHTYARAFESLGYPQEFFMERVAQVVVLMLGLSLLCSALLTAMEKKSGLILYYFQFPIKCLLVAMTFGFLPSLLNMEPGTYATTGLIYGLEILRLVFTIFVHRKYYGTPQSTTTINSSATRD